MKVKDFHHNDPDARLSFVQASSSIDEVYEALMSNKESRVVYVTDQEEKLVGQIDIGTIINLYGCKFSSGPIDMLTKFSKLLAHKASDLMSTPIYVRMENHISIAIKVMMESSIYEMPVINEERKVIGNVTCFELLQALKDHHGEF